MRRNTPLLDFQSRRLSRRRWRRTELWLWILLGGVALLRMLDAAVVPCGLTSPWIFRQVPSLAVLWLGTCLRVHLHCNREELREEQVENVWRLHSGECAEARWGWLAALWASAQWHGRLEWATAQWAESVERGLVDRGDERIARAFWLVIGWLVLLGYCTRCTSLYFGLGGSLG